MEDIELDNLAQSVNTDANNIKKYYRRWYDKDPELSYIVSCLENSDTNTKIKLAMKIIKSVISQNIVDLHYENIDDIMNIIYSGYDDPRRLRWYDMDSTVRTAMHMLQHCPEEIQYHISSEIKNEYLKINKLTIM